MLREDIEAVDKIELFKLVPLGPTTLAWGRIKKELSELAQLSHNSDYTAALEVCVRSLRLSGIIAIQESDIIEAATRLNSVVKAQQNCV